MAVVSLFVLLLIQVIAVTLEYELRCPVAGEWRLRPRKLLCGATQYVCLLYLPDNTHKETCDGLDYSSTGSKLVFQPNFNKARCNQNQYQPFPFSTDGNSACVYKKSFCNAEGQFLFNKGSFEKDTRCGCDVSKGFIFVTKPKNKCYCIPLEEDCSCYQSNCNHKGNDCALNKVVIMNATCSVLPEYNKPPDERINKRQHTFNYDDNGRGRKHRLPCVYLTVTVLILTILTGFIADQCTITVTVNDDKIATEYGKLITLTCDVSIICSCFVKSIKWYKDKNKTECCQSKTTKYESEGRRPMLTINDVGINDLGYYTCVLETIFFTYKSENIQVVYALPVITVKEKTIEILENRKSINLSCEVCSESELISSKWFKGSDEISGISEKYELKGNLHKVLTIRDVCVSDSGTYKCRVENKKGHTESDPIVVEYPLPVITVKENTIEIIKNRKCINLSCEVHSESKLTSIKWFKGSDEISVKWQKYELKYRLPKSLTIRDVCASDSGTYTCRVENKKGHTESEGITVEYQMPTEIQRMNSKERNIYMDALKSGNEVRRFVRIKVIGKNGVGKSCLVRRLLGKEIEDVVSTHGVDSVQTCQIDTRDGKFRVDKYNTNSKQTHGSEIRSHEHDEHENPELSEIYDEITENMSQLLYEIRNREKDGLKSEDVVECGIWDFADQKEYYVTQNTLFTSNSIYLLVANLEEDIKPIEHVEDDQNFDSIGEDIGFWFDTIHSFCDDHNETILNPPVIMVCTHTDRFQRPDERKLEYKQQFDDICVQDKKFTHTRGIHFISNTGITGDIDKLKREINKIAAEMNYFQEKVPTRWIQLENALNYFTKTLNKKIMSWTSINKLAEQTCKSSTNELRVFLKYQHAIGNIIFFEEIQDYIILQPIWLIQCFRCLVCDNDKEKRSSKISTTDWTRLIATRVLSDTILVCLFEQECDLETVLKQYLLDVMEKFDFIVKLQCVDTKHDASTNSYYIPCMFRNQKTSLQNIKKRIEADKTVLTTSPWLILEFTYFPFTYFNHILVSYIREYTVCGKENEQKDIFGGKAVFFLDDSQSIKFIICYSKNAISLQIWDWNERSDDPYEKVLETLRRKIKELEKKIRHILTYNITAKCSDGHYFKRNGRICYKDLETLIFKKRNYFCSEHNVMHSPDEIVNTWFKHIDEHNKIFEKHEEKIEKRTKDTKVQMQQLTCNARTARGTHKDMW